MQSQYNPNHKSSLDITQNQQIILQSLDIFTPITITLLKLQQQLYANANSLPRSIYKEFRKLRDDIETLSSLISSFSSDNADFMEHKDTYLQQQIQAIESQINRQQINKGKPQQSRSRPSLQIKKTDLDQTEKRNQLLLKQIQSLKNQLRRNDAQYEIEIKKYNIKYQQMQDQIDYYRRESQKLQEYIDEIERLEVDNRVLKEARQRDQQLIQNMAWKLRNLQKDRYGKSAFLSPRASKNGFAGNSSRIQTSFSPKSYIRVHHE